MRGQDVVQAVEFIILGLFCTHGLLTCMFSFCLFFIFSVSCPSGQSEIVMFYSKSKQKVIASEHLQEILSEIDEIWDLLKIWYCRSSIFGYLSRTYVKPRVILQSKNFFLKIHSVLAEHTLWTPRFICRPNVYLFQ